MGCEWPPGVDEDDRVEMGWQVREEWIRIDDERDRKKCLQNKTSEGV